MIHFITVDMKMFNKVSNDPVVFITKHHKIDNGDWIIFNTSNESGSVDQIIRQVTFVSDDADHICDGFTCIGLGSNGNIVPCVSTDFATSITDIAKRSDTNFTGKVHTRLL